MRIPASPVPLALCSFLLGSGVCGLLPDRHPQPAVADEGRRPASAVETAAEPTGDWPQWGGSPVRNNVPVGVNIPQDWDVGGFDRQSGAWLSDQAKNIKWAAAAGSQTYGNPVIADGRVFVGTNNGRGYLPRYPNTIDLGCLLAFSTADGSFLWQHSSEKLPTGRVHDWPLQGICCAPLVEGDRLWYVTSRGEVVCLDTQGFHDHEDDGPLTGGLAHLYRGAPALSHGLDNGQVSDGLSALFGSLGHPLGDRPRVVTETPGESWTISLRVDRKKQFYGVRRSAQQLQLSDQGLGDEPGPGPGPVLLEVPDDLRQGLGQGAPSAALRSLLASRGIPLPDTLQTTSRGANQWQINAQVAGTPRDLLLRMEGPNLAAYKQLSVVDRNEADTVWVFNMMDELGVSQHNMCSCSVTALGDLLFVNTSNGVDESHKNIPSVRSPSFIALQKETGAVVWTDDSPGENILHGQWSSPAAGLLAGVPQVVFAGGDGWVYSFQADRWEDGRPLLLWKFDANPKDSEWILGGRGTRNNIIGTPVLFQDRVYIAVGQDPEHGPGEGHLWCIDPSKRGDISPQLVVHVNDRTQVVPHRRLKALEATEGEVAIDNRNSGVIWHYSRFDQDGDGQFDTHEMMNRSCGTVAIKDDLLFIADFSGIFHCLDAMTGRVHWTYDMLSSAWGSPLIVDGKVYVGDEDGEIAVFLASAEPQVPLAEIDMLNSVYSTPVVAHNVLYIANKTHLFAIEAAE